MRLYRRNDTGEAVRDIQERLERLGHALEVSGRFDDATQEAVRAFQERRSIPADGIVGPDTWRELVEADRNVGDRVLYY
ncbi:MAG: peptidoglycan-binding protein, partial [Acidimicrobiia bacterium]|nr:peptidoglycan-binding protein [Acidimicrobiia bacterium]